MMHADFKGCAKFISLLYQMCARSLHADVTRMRTQDACRCHALREIHMFLLEMCARSLHEKFTRMRTHDVRRFHALCGIQLLLREVCARSLHANFKRCLRFKCFSGRCAHAVCTTLCGCARKAYACTRGPEHEA